MNKFGFNIQVPGAGLGLIGRHKPLASLLMDVKSEHIAEAERLSPETEIIFRKEDGRKWRDKDPIEWAQAMWADVHEYPPDWVVPDNEPLGHAAIGEFAALDQWQRAFADWIHSNTSMKVGMFGFPEGNFTKDGPIIPEHFPLSMEAADAVFIHEYWKPHLDSPGMEDYHWGRWVHWLKWFESAGYPNMPIYVTEVGITMAVNALPHGEPSGPDVGYASEEAKAAGVTDETYLNDLEEYHRRCCLEPRVKAVLPFIWCPWPGEWGSFVPTAEMTKRIFSFDAPGPDPEPEPEPPEEQMVAVYGKNGVLLEREAADDMVAYHGLSWEMPLNLQPGGKFYNLKVLRFKTGNVAFIYRVRDLDGNLIVNLDEEMDRNKAHRAWWWPDVCGANDIVTTFPTDYDACADLGGLNENGEGGSPIDAWHDPYQPGPYRAWVRHPTIPSVVLKGIGMAGSTNHDHMDGEWKEEIFQGDDPDPNGDKQLILKHVITESHTENMLGVVLPVNFAVERDARGEFGGPGVDVPPIYPKEWTHPDGTKMALMEGCCSFGGTVGESRTFSMFAFDLSTGERLTEPKSETFASLETEGSTERRVYVYELKEAPDPEPPVDDVAGQIIYYAGEIIKLAQSGDLDSVEEVHLVAKDGNKRVFVPKSISTVLWRMVGSLLGK